MGTTAPAAGGVNFKEVLSWIPGWLGFLALIVVGVVMVIVGAAVSPPEAKLGFIDFGLCAVAIGTISWISGATSEIKGRAGKVGVKVKLKDLPWWAWVANAGVLAAAVIIFLVAR